MNWLLSAILCGLLVEVALRLPFSVVVERVSRSGSRAIGVLRSKAVSDHWKEKAMAAYAQTTFTSSIKLAGLLLVLAAVAAVLVAAFEQISRGFYPFILSWRGLAFGIVFASLYLATRKFVAHVRL